jgi:hypothetical protein
VTEFGGDRIVLAGSLEEPSPSETSAVPRSPDAASKWACVDYACMFPLCLERKRSSGASSWSRAETGGFGVYVTRSLQRSESPRLSSGSPMDGV